MHQLQDRDVRKDHQTRAKSTVIPTDVQRACDKIPHPFTRKTLKREELLLHRLIFLGRGRGWGG
jgi:hypothetical protein